MASLKDSLYSVQKSLMPKLSVKELNVCHSEGKRALQQLKFMLYNLLTLNRCLLKFRCVHPNSTNFCLDNSVLTSPSFLCSRN